MSETILDDQKRSETVVNPSENKVNRLSYPSVSERMKAAVLDGAILIALLFVLSEFFDGAEAEGQTKMIIFFCMFGLYDPLFTSLFGGTIGHLLSGLRVRRQSDPIRKIMFPVALIRFVFKSSLGWISLLTIGSNKHSRAIHDLVAGSVVIQKLKQS